VLERRPVFKDGTFAAESLAHVTRTAQEERFEVLAYCFMPDHLHLLVKGADDESDLRRFAKMSKQRSGYAYKNQCGARLWQEGYFERVLRDDSEAREIARYIVTNPVRAGLVTRADEYEFVGTTEWTIEELSRVALDEEVSRTS
jgi:REP-associated tyrosine transposase